MQPLRLQRDHHQRKTDPLYQKIERRTSEESKKTIYHRCTIHPRRPIRTVHHIMRKPPPKKNRPRQRFHQQNRRNRNLPPRCESTPRKERSHGHFTRRLFTQRDQGKNKNLALTSQLPFQFPKCSNLQEIPPKRTTRPHPMPFLIA